MSLEHFNTSGNHYDELIENEPILKSVCKVIDSWDNPVYLIGGYVRDFILQRPTKDIDIVVLGDGIKLAKAVSDSLHQSSFSVFKNFGTAMIKLNDIEVQFVGARKESYSRNSRNPIVSPGSLEEDQNRRDFTINALAISLNGNSKGSFVDPFNGVKDLMNGIIKTPLNPTETFSDDPLRMLRAIRFTSQLGFIISDETLEGITKNAERINIVAQERITEELNKIIMSDYPSLGFKLLEKTNLLTHIFPEFQALKGVDTINGKKHKDNFYHTLEVLENILEKSTSNLWLRWAVLLHDIAKPATKRFDHTQGWTFHGHDDKGAKMVPKIFKRMKLPLDHNMRYVQKLVLLHLRPISLTNDHITDSALRRLLFEAGDDLEDLMCLCQSDITSKNIEKKQRYLKRFEVVQKKLKEVEERDKIKNWQPPINGKEIMDTLNLLPGKEVGQIKEGIKNAILDGVIKNDTKEARDFMLKLAKSKGIL